jgi:hypothetical protein
VNVATIVQLAVGAGSLGSVWLAGSGRVAAWPLLIGAHAVFLGYAATSGQFGFWLLNVGMIAIAARNWRKATSRRPALAQKG